MHGTTITNLTYLAAAMSLGHHVDHVLRGNAGWPVTGDVNAFTISLAIYPTIAVGLYLYRAGRIGPGSWAIISGGGAAFVAAVHFGPLAIEPPEQILGMYDPPILGWMAFAWLVGFVALLIVTSQLELRMWWHQRQGRLAGGLR
jgi:hypothetical protein